MVSAFEELVLLTPLIVVVAFAGAQALPFQVSTWPLLAPVSVPSVVPFILETTVALRLPVTSPPVFTVNAVLAIPFTVLTNWLVPFCVKVLLLIMFTEEPVTPFTVVLSVLELEVLLTVFVVGVQEVPFQISSCPLVGAVEETALPWSWFAFQ